jgi:competence protein ComEA
MKARSREEPATTLVGRTIATAKLGAVVSAARDWRWGAVVGKVLLAGLGLVVLGAIGRSALARSVLSTDAPALDAGLLPAIPTTAPAPMTMPAVVTPAVAASPSTAAVSDSGAPVAPVTSPSAHGRATPDDPVYLNQATLADLRRLPGVGAKRAEAILALRTRLGHFRQIEDLLKVKGVGRSSLKKLRPLVRLDPPPARTIDAGADGAVAPS